MGRQLFANNVVSSLSAAVTATDTLLSFTSDSAFPAIAANSGDWFYLTLVDETGWEIVKVLAGTCSPYTVERGVDGSNAREWPRFARVELRATAASLRDIQNSVDNLASEKGEPLGIATLSSNGKLTESQLPASVVGTMQYQGTWDASSNIPQIPAASDLYRGHYFVVSTAGNTTIDGISDWKPGDWIVCNATTWAKIDNTDQVVSVCGKNGIVVIDVADIIGLQSALDLKQSAAASDILAKIVTVDGHNSGLDADTLDGNHASYFEPSLLAPAADDYMLVSKVDRTRRWVAPYVHPTGDGNLHVPATGSSNYNYVLKAGNAPGMMAWSQVHWNEIVGAPSTFSASAHAATHMAGGSDPLFPANALGYLHNNGSGTLAFQVPTPDEIGALPAASAAVDALKLGGQLPAYYLPAATYTGADILAKLAPVDGANSGLDADTLDGQHGAYYRDWANITNKPTYTPADVGALPAAGTAVDSSKLGGQPPSFYLPVATFTSTYTAADVLTKLQSVDGTGSGLDADTVDGRHASYFSISTHTHTPAEIGALGVNAQAADSALLGGQPPSFYLSTAGASASAVKLATARAIALDGDATGSVLFDGTADVTIPTTLKSVISSGTYAIVNVNAKGLVTSGSRPFTLSGFGIIDAVNQDRLGVAGGVATLDSSGKVPVSQLPDTVLGTLQYQGVWDASTNVPAIPAAAAGNKGWYYAVNVAGTTAVNGINDWGVGDWIVSNGTAWSKIDNTDSVTSVAGKQGAVTLTVADIIGLQTALDNKATAAVGTTYNASDVLTKLLLVDGTGSGLDADMLDGHDSTYFLSTTGVAADSSKLGGQPASSYLSTTSVAADSSKLGGQLPSYYLAASTYTAADILTKIKTVDGAASGLDADMLDGQDSSYYAAASHTHTAAQVGALAVGGTAVDSNKLGGQPPSFYLPVTGQAADAWKLGGQAPSYYQVALGFTPVQQGGGTGQGTNKVYIGWSGTRLKAQVDTSDLGNFVFDSQLSAYQPTSTAINTSNIGSQSVSYAASAGSVAWTNVSGRPSNISAFTNDSGYITAAALAPYAPLNGPVFQGAGGGLNFVNASSSGGQLQVRSDGGSSTAAMISFHRPGAYAAYFGLDTDGQFKVGGWSMGNVAYTLWHSGNFNPASYQLASSAINTSNIGSQSVNYANSAGAVAWSNVTGRPGGLGVTGNWNWSGQSGQPPWVWGGSDGQNFYVYNPANFSVNYATTAGSANSVAWTNVSGRPSALSAFSNDAGYMSDGGSYGTIHLNNWIRSSGSTGWYNETYAVGFYATGSGLIQTYNNASLQVNGTLYATGDVIAYYSDARLKKDVKPIENALSKALAIRGITFRANELAASFGITDEREQVGVLAQEVMAVMPQLVAPAPFNNEYMTVKYDRLVPLLFEALREQMSIIDSLRERIEKLEGK
jgi:hypothetical protein